MATKRNGVPCYDKAGLDEPIFVLRAQDVLADEVVAFWASRARENGVSAEKIREARECAVAMQKWPGRKNPD